MPWVEIDFEGGLLLFKRPQGFQIENFIRNFMSTTLRPILFCTTLHVGKVYDSLLKKKSRCINPQTIEKKNGYNVTKASEDRKFSNMYLSKRTCEIFIIDKSP